MAVEHSKERWNMSKECFSRLVLRHFNTQKGSLGDYLGVKPTR